MVFFSDRNIIIFFCPKKIFRMENFFSDKRSLFSDRKNMSHIVCQRMIGSTYRGNGTYADSQSRDE